MARLDIGFPFRCLGCLQPTSSRATTLAIGVIDRIRGNIARCQRSGSMSSSIPARNSLRSEEHTSELQSLMRISYAVFCLKKKKKTQTYKQQLKLSKLT